MRKETENWWKQALSDFHKAEVLYKSNDYDGVAFYCQQTVEKSLKALYITKFKKNPPKVHDLTLLCDYVEKVPEKRDCKKLFLLLLFPAEEWEANNL